MQYEIMKLPIYLCVYIHFPLQLCIIFEFLESFTPDGHGLLGPNPDISGLYHAHTMNSIGMSYSGGVGDMMAQWIVNGEPNMSMYAFDIRWVSFLCCASVHKIFSQSALMMHWSLLLL